MKAFVFGAGAHGRVVADMLRDSACESIAFVDDNAALAGSRINGIPVAGTLDDAARSWDAASGLTIALGNPMQRLRIAERARALGATFLNVVHRSAVVAPTASIGQGNMIGAGAVVNSNARLGSHVIVNTAAVVEHDAVLEDGATICPCAYVGGRATVRRAAFIGSGARLLPRVAVGAGSIVAAAAVATRDVAPGALVMGMPARVVEQVTETFDWRRVL